MPLGHNPDMSILTNILDSSVLELDESGLNLEDERSNLCFYY